MADRRGGRREGAGRKRLGLPKLEKITLRVAPQTREGLAAAAKDMGVSISQMIEDMFANYESTETDKTLDAMDEQSMPS